TELTEEDILRGTTTRDNFGVHGEGGRVYKIGTLNGAAGSLGQVQVERRGTSRDYPTILTTAERASWRTNPGWTLSKGEMKLIADSTPDFSIEFARMVDKQFPEGPRDMMAK